MGYKLKCFWWKLQLKARRFNDWIIDLIPIQCANCGRWISGEDNRPAEMTTGAVVNLCQDCYADLYGE